MFKLVGVVAVHWKGRDRTGRYLGWAPSVPYRQDAWFRINTKTALLVMIVSI